MSTRIMAIVWPVQLPPTQKSVLVSLADNANDAGECWPSLATISERTCFGKQAVIDAIKGLEQAGILSADRSNGRHTRYTINVRNLSTSQTGLPDRPVCQTDRNLSTSQTKPVCQTDTNRQEPSLNQEKGTRVRSPEAPPGGKPSKREVTFSDWESTLGDQDAIPADDPIFDWAEKAGIPIDFLRLAWRAFVDRYCDSGKRYANWRAVFRNSVRGNWLKIWWVSPAGIALTTIGEQYRRVIEAEDAELGGVA